MLTVAVVFLADCEAERSKKHNDVVSILCHLICLIPQMYSSLGTVIISTSVQSSKQLQNHRTSKQVVAEINVREMMITLRIET